MLQESPKSKERRKPSKLLRRRVPRRMTKREESRRKWRQLLSNPKRGCSPNPKTM